MSAFPSTVTFAVPSSRTAVLYGDVNVPADNLFVFDNKKGPAIMSTIDAFNLIGRAGRVTLNEMGNVYIVIDDERKQKYFDEVLLKPLPNQELLPQKALEKRHKIAIVSTLLQGKTNLIEANEKYSDRGFTETTYEYATKCLNMLVNDICSKNSSYIVRDFRRSNVLTPQNIIDIRRLFGEIADTTDSSILGKPRLIRSSTLAAKNAVPSRSLSI